MAAAQPNGHAAPATDSGSGAQKLQPNDVGWQFVPQYYNFVNKQPHRLHCFYNKRSTFIHGEEGEEAQVALGQQEIHERINAIGYDNCKVFIHSIDSQASAGGGIILLVIGEMSNNSGPWRKFTQTFFLAEQPNGYFVLNDIFRYLKEEEEEDEMEVDPANQEMPVGVPSEAPAQVPNAAPVPVPTFNHPPTPDSSEKNAPQSSTPKPSQAPAHPDPKAVPTEAVVASVPDEDKAPQEPPAAVEEPVTTAPPPPVEEAPAPTPTPAAAPKANGTPAQAPAAPAAPAKPAAPKTWASMAAASAAGSSGAKAWGGMGTQAAASSSNAPPPAAAPVATPPPKKEEAAAPASEPLPNLEGKHPYYVNAMKTTTPHCFVKLPGWNSENQAGGDQTDEPAIRAASSRFGEVKNIEIVRDKACAFVEFVKVESARLAIAASLTPAQGGEGGVKLANGRLMSFGPRKEKDERRPKGSGGARGGMAERGGRGGGPGAAGQGQGQGRPQEGQGERGQGSGRGRGGRGRGGPPGGDRPAPQK